jgi:type IV pilus assembly protein PilV
MQLSKMRKPLGRQAGFNLLEVLVSLLIVTVGLLGLAGTQVVAQRAEQESYQRAQAMVVMSDIIDRINANRKVAVCYAITDDASAGTKYLGTPPTSGSGKYDPAGFSCPSMATNPNAVTRAGLDVKFIDNMLLGAAESLGGGKVGAMIGARACIGFDSASQSYSVAVAWQGNTRTFSPATWDEDLTPALARNCAKELYGDETQRRIVWTTLIIANLQ